MSMETNITKPKRYHPLVVTLHWLVAILILSAFLFVNEDEGGRERFRPPQGQGQQQPGNFPPPSFQPDNNESSQSNPFSTIGIHMILGVTTLLLLVIRLIARWRTQHPEWATTGNPFLDKVGNWTHFGLYVLAFLMPITGIILAVQRGELARTFGIGTFVRGSFHRGQFSLGMFHGAVWTLLLLLIALHVGAALYHQFIRKDNLLARMWYGKQ